MWASWDNNPLEITDSNILYGGDVMWGSWEDNPLEI
jgi:hypothetical protein